VRLTAESTQRIEAWGLG